MASEPTIREPEPAARPVASPEAGDARQTGLGEPDATSETTKSEAVEQDGASGQGASDPFAFTPEELRLVQKLSQRDLEVRTHEQAHVAAGGQYVTSGPSYDYQTGPDGRRYAIGGEVGIDTSPIPGDPEATVEKARVLIRAALAPAEPSSQDQRVAASARSMEVEASSELVELEREERAQAAEASLEAAQARLSPESARSVQPDEQGARAAGEELAVEPGISAAANENAQAQGAPAARGLVDARQQLEARIAAFFAPPDAARGYVSQFA
ncbi:MAG: hypothetical protein JXM75_12550 [Chromatiaceae bacterium]|nr:hypothetical protein [Chromatiaceae bacterium]